MTSASAGELRRSMAAARSILGAHLSGPPARVVRERGGLTNLVYRATHPEGDFVVRLSRDPDKLDVFLRERSAMLRARKAGVPCPVVLGIGDEAPPYVYMLSRRVRGIVATRYPDRLRILRAMGGYARTVHSIPTEDFGTRFEWRAEVGEPGRAPSFREFLRYELELDSRLELLASQRMLPESVLDGIKTLLESSELDGRSPALNHGDLRLKNVLVDKAGEITAIIDWEDCTSSLAPEWDWSIALHDLNVDEKQAFLEGYGASAASIVRHMPVAKALNVVNYAPIVAEVARGGNDDALEAIRLRLRGTLDLFAL